MNQEILRDMSFPDINHTTMMTALSDKHQTIADLIGNRSFHYVDYPVHGNIGDLLIMHGTLAFFRRYGLKPRISDRSLCRRRPSTR